MNLARLCLNLRAFIGVVGEEDGSETSQVGQAWPEAAEGTVLIGWMMTWVGSRFQSEDRSVVCGDADEYGSEIRRQYVRSLTCH